MAQRDLVNVVGGVVVGVIGAMVVGAAFFGISFTGGRETRVTLVDLGQGCTLGKETNVWAKGGKNLTWKIENRCLAPQTVSVGDFRLTENPAALDCSREGAAYPFDPGAREVAVEKGEPRKPAKADLKLKAKKHDQTEVTSYYFNICLNGTPADPRLLVER